MAIDHISEQNFWILQTTEDLIKMQENLCEALYVHKPAGNIFSPSAK